MKTKIFLATQNEGKNERYKNLIMGTGLNIQAYTPKDLGLENLEIEETGKTLAENAEIKARAYFGKVDMPILANDSGLWVEGIGLIDAPKRHALGEAEEKNLTKEEISKNLLEFWKGIAKKHGGRVNAAWMDFFMLLKPNGESFHEEAKREIILTNQIFGAPHIQFPIRALYISKDTNKPAVLHTKEEEFLELKPITDALFKLLTHLFTIQN